MNDPILREGTPAFLNELDKMRTDGDEPALAPLTPQQRKDIEQMSAADQIAIARRIREAAHQWDDDARLCVAQRFDQLIRELSEASAFLRRRRVDSKVSPAFDLTSSPFFRRQVGPT